MTYEDTADLIGEDMGNDPEALASAEAATAEVLARQKPAKNPKYEFRDALQRSRELKGATKLVGLLLADFVNLKDGYAFPTLQEIMDRLSIPETTAKRALRNLKDRVKRDPVTGVESVIPGSGWFRCETTKSKNGASYRNHWHPNFVKAGLEVGGHFDPLPSDREGGGGHFEPPRGPSVAPHILTLHSPDSVIGGDIATLVASSNPIEEDSHLTAAGMQQEDGPDCFGLGERREWSDQGEKAVELPQECPFDQADVDKAIAAGLTASDIAAAEASFREATAGQKRTPAKWRTGARGWLKRQKAVAETASAKGTLLPENFTTDAETVNKAMAFGLTRSEVQEAHSAFLCHYLSVTGTKAYSRDWRLTWGNWMREAARRKKSQNTKHPTNSLGMRHTI